MISFDNILLVTSASVAGVLNIIGFLLSFSYAKKSKNRLVYLFSANWLLQSFFWALDAASHFYYSPLLMALAIIPQVIGVPCLFIFIDLIKKERVSSIKITILLLLEITMLYFYFMPGGMEIIPGYGVHIVGALRFIQIIFLFYYVITYFSWSYLTWKRAPSELKQLVNFLLFGSILFSFVTATLYSLGTFIKIFNSLGFITHSLGALFTIIVIW